MAEATFPISAVLSVGENNSSFVTWNSGTAINTVASLVSNDYSYNTIIVTLNQTTTITGGIATFEGSIDGVTFFPLQGFAPGTFAPVGPTYTLQASTYATFSFNLTGIPYFQVRLSAVVTGTGAVTVGFAADSFVNTIGAAVTGTVTVNGSLTHNNAAPAANNIGALTGVASSAAPTYNAGDQVLLSTDLAGNARVILNAETTKVIGAVNQAAASSPWVNNITQWASTALGVPQTFGTAPSGVVIGTSSDIYVAGTRARSNQTTTAAGVVDVNIVGSLGVTNSVTNGTFIAITDNTTKAGVIATTTSLKTDWSSEAGTAITTVPVAFGTGTPSGNAPGVNSALFVGTTPVRSNQTTTATGTVDVNNVGIDGVTIVTAAAGVQKVGIVGNAGAVLDATVTAGTAPANMAVIGGVYNATSTTLTTGQSIATQLDQQGNELGFPGVQTTDGATWTSATTINTLQYPTGTATIGAPIGAPAIIVQLEQTSTITGGAVTFQGTYDGTNWVTIPVAQIIHPQTYTQLSNPYTFVANTNQPFLILGQGFQQIRLNLTTVITGTGSVMPDWTVLPTAPAIAISSVNTNVSVAGVYNVTEPSPANTGTTALQQDQAANLLYFPGVQFKTGAAWNSATTINTLQFTTGTSSAGQFQGNSAVVVQLDQTTTITGGAVTFQGTYDNINWVTIPTTQVLNPNTFVQLTNPYTFVASTNQPFLLLLQGYAQVRANLTTVITGTGSVTPYWGSTADGIRTTMVATPGGTQLNVSIVPTSNTFFRFGDVTLNNVQGIITPVRRTAYTEQTTNAQRSLSSSSANDAAAGTGARTVMITYYDQTGAGPFTETVTLNGVTAVATVSTTICFIERMIVVTVGTNLSNVGVITLFVNAAGGGGTIGTIGTTTGYLGGSSPLTGDNSTFWAHHYVPTGKTFHLTGLSVGNQSTSAPNGGVYTIGARTLPVANQAEVQITDFVRLYGQSSTTTRLYNSPIQVTGPARLILYCASESNTSTLFRGSFDYYEQ